MIRVVVAAAGAGRRFAEAGYREPKPLIDVLGEPMIQRVITNIRPPEEHRVTVLSQVPLPGIDAHEVRIVGPNRGAVETILQADLDGWTLIANCDQLVSTDWICPAPADGFLLTFRSAKPHHSYVRVADGFITEIAEKRVISSQAVAGVYCVADGAAFRSAAEVVLKEDRKVLGEFYVSTVIDELIRRGLRLRAVECRCAVLGTPEELDLFIAAAEVAKTL